MSADRPILIFLNTAWNAVNFREDLICGLLDRGYTVKVIAPRDKYVGKLIAFGCGFIECEFSSTSKGLLSNLVLLKEVFKIFLRERPAAVLTYTIKCNLFGGIVARSLRIPVLINIAGLGRLFEGSFLTRELIKKAYMFTISSRTTVFFQNEVDRELFLSSGVVDSKRAVLLPGSGISLDTFRFIPLNSAKETTFIMVCRLLKSKGVFEFFQAAQLFAAAGRKARFVLAGFGDDNDPSYVHSSDLKRFNESEGFEFIGASDSVGELLRQSSCVVLPSSYPEGTPRILLEAGATGRPIITTNTPGCRDTVIDRVTGFLCPPGDSFELSKAMIEFVDMSPKEQSVMAEASRLHISENYDVSFVVLAYIRALESSI